MVVGGVFGVFESVGSGKGWQPNVGDRGANDLMIGMIGLDIKEQQLLKDWIYQGVHAGVALLDPLKLLKSIETLEQEIMEFESNVDFVLSESNSITSIEIED